MTLAPPELPPYPRAHLVPEQLRDVLLDFWWDTERLFALDLPALAPIQVADLEWHLSLPIWTHLGRQFAVSPQQVEADPASYAQHHRRTLRADLRFPIVTAVRGGRLVIVDGCHRLLKARMAGLTSVRCVELLPEHHQLIAHRPVRPASLLDRALQVADASGRRARAYDVLMPHSGSSRDA